MSVLIKKQSISTESTQSFDNTKMNDSLTKKQKRSSKDNFFNLYFNMESDLIEDEYKYKCEPNFSLTRVRKPYEDEEKERKSQKISINLTNTLKNNEISMLGSQPISQQNYILIKNIENHVSSKNTNIILASVYVQSPMDTPKMSKSNANPILKTRNSHSPIHKRVSFNENVMIHHGNSEFKLKLRSQKKKCGCKFF